MDMNGLEQGKHDMLPTPTHDELARQQFARSFKEHIVAKIHPGVRVAYDKRVQPEIAKTTGKASESIRVRIRAPFGDLPALYFPVTSIPRSLMRYSKICIK